MAKKLSTGELLERLKTGEMSVDDLLELLKTGEMSVDDLLVLLKTALEKTASEPAFKTTLERAFKGLYIHYSSRFYRYLRNRWRFSHEDAEELLDDVFMLVLKSAHRFDPARGQGAPLLWTICHNAAVSRRRQVDRTAKTTDSLSTIDDEDAIIATLPLEDQVAIAKVENAIDHCLTWSLESLSLDEQMEIAKGRGTGGHPRPAWSAATKRREEVRLSCLKQFQTGEATNE